MNMKIWKIVTIAVMLAAPAVFAAPTLQLSPSPATVSPQVTSIPVQPGVPFTLNVNLLMGPTDVVPVTQVSFAVYTDAPAGMIRLTDRVILSNVLTDPTTANATLLSSANSALSPKNAKDAGLTSFDGATGVPASATLETLTFTISGPIPNPSVLKIVGAGSFVNGTWGDAEFNSFDLQQTSITLAPEPASMLLLAAGAAFFARRRRA